MGIFDIINSARNAINKQINPAYAGNKDFLEAVAAAAALVAAADGDASPAEQQETVNLLTTHKDLSRIYTSRDIKAEVEKAFGRAMSGSSGKQGLVRELNDIKGKSEMCTDVYWIASDVAQQGGVSDKEEAAMTRLAEILNVKVGENSAAGF